MRQTKEQPIKIPAEIERQYETLGYVDITCKKCGVSILETERIWWYFEPEIEQMIKEHKC